MSRTMGSRMMLAKVYEENGDIEAALGTMEEGLKWPNSYNNEEFLNYTADLAMKNKDFDLYNSVLQRILKQRRRQAG